MPHAKHDNLAGKIVLVGFGLRILAALAVHIYLQSAGRPFLIEGDANGYWQLAQNVAAGSDYAIHVPPRYVLRTPGFPLLLAASMACFGNSILAARLVLAFVGTVCCWLTWHLGKRILNSKTGLVACAFVALNPIHIGNSVLILSETWFAMWMLLSLIALADLFRLTELSNQQRADRRGSLLGGSLISGILIGFTVLVRPGFLPWLAAAWIALTVIPWIRSRRQKRLEGGAENGKPKNLAALQTCAVCVAMTIGCGLALLPWALRNQKVTGHLVFTSLWSGPSLYDGLNPDANGQSDMTFFDRERVMNRMSEVEMNEHYKTRAWDFVLNNPKRAMELTLPKAKQFLSPIPNSLSEVNWVVSAICAACWAIVFGGAVAGIVILRKSGFVLLLSIGPLLLFLLVHMVFVGSVRYRLPVEFPLCLLSACGWLAVTGHQTCHSESDGS